jgi:predicted nucleotidyltransferase
MPVRSLNSSVLKWPDRKTVEQAVRSWARTEGPRHPELVQLGYFGSCARGDWGVGSDLDLVAVVRDAAEPFERRGISWNLADLPVAAEILVYTEDEWRGLHEEDSKFSRTLRVETVWVV